MEEIWKLYNVPGLLVLSLRDGPEMTGPMNCFAAFPEMRVYGKIVSDWVLPPVIVLLVEGKMISARETLLYKLTKKWLQFVAY